VPDSVADILDADPDLAMVLRPSLDYRLAIAWHKDPSRTCYWRLALGLAAQRSGHMLAAAAAATVAAHELRNAAELEALESSCIVTANNADWTVDDARGLAFLVAAGLDAPDTNAAALDAFGQLLEALAVHALNNDDIGLARLVAQLCRRAASDRLPTRGTQGADSWVQAAIAAVLVGLADLNDPRRADLADYGGPALAMATTLDTAAAADTIRLIIAEPALLAWGVRAVRPLIDALPDIAAQDPALAVDIGASVWQFQGDTSQSTNITNSQILHLISTGQQDLESVRFQVRQGFPGLAAIDVLAATNLFLKIVESRSLPEYAHIGSQTNQRPRVRYGDDLQHAGGYGSLSAMADALIDRLEHTAPTCSDAIDLLIENLTHAEAWNRLLHRAAISESVGLANVLRPALSSPSLLAHGQTWPAAGHLAARVCRTLTAAEYKSLEQTILAATEPGPDDSELRRNGLRERRDILLTATRAARIGVDATHLLSPVLPPDDQPYDEQGSTDTTELSSEARLLHEVNEALEKTNRAEDHDDASRRLMALWPQLNTRHAAAPSNRHLHERMIEAAGHIASLPEVLPDTAVGREIFLAVQTAMPQPTRAGGQPGVNPDLHGSWSGTPETAALTAARVLLARSEWLQVHGEWLRGCLLSHLDSSRWVYRFLSTCAISLLYTEPDEVLFQVDSRLTTETDHHVARALISVLGRQLYARPGEVDLIFSQLAVRRGSPYLIDPGQDGPEFRRTLAEAVVHCLTTLAVRYGTPFADATIRAWLSTPIDNPTTVAVIAGHLRGILNPADPSLRDAQRRAFDLLTLTLEPLGVAWADPAQAANAPTIAERVAQEVYHASGAFKAEEQSRTELGDPEVFASLALPLLDGVGQVRHPAVTHPIIETVEHLGDAQPKPALLLAMRAITEDSRYITEPLGVDAVLRLINRYIADHRELVLGDPECTTAVRVLLERFVRVGWPQAVQMAERMDELFR
jgi:hypothetical protein